MMNQDGSMQTLTPEEFQKRLLKLTPQEREYVLKMRQELGIDTKEAP